MVISLALGEIQNRCNDWESFCNEFGWSEWCCSEGGVILCKILQKNKLLSME